MTMALSGIRRLAIVLMVVTCLAGGVAAVPAAAAATACDGTIVDARVSTVQLCGTMTVGGTGGDSFDLVVPSDTVISLGACGGSAMESYLCDLETTGDSDIRGMVIHERNPEGTDWAYQVLAERSQRLTGGYRELTVGRGFTKIMRNQQEAFILPAGGYRVRLIGDEREMLLRLATSAAGSTQVVPVPNPIDWRDVEPAYGNSTVGGAGDDFSVNGPTLALFAYGWLPDTYVTEAQFGVCIYEDPTTVDQTAWAPGCPDRVTGNNDAFELVFGTGFGGPYGQGFAVAYAGDSDEFAWGGYHQTLGVGGTQTAVAFQLELE